MVSRGDFGDFIEALSNFGVIDSNVGMGSQFSENTFYTNKGFSNYTGLLATLTQEPLRWPAVRSQLHLLPLHRQRFADCQHRRPSAAMASSATWFAPRSALANSDFDQKHIIYRRRRVRSALWSRPDLWRHHAVLGQRDRRAAGPSAPFPAGTRGQPSPRPRVRSWLVMPTTLPPSWWEARAPSLPTLTKLPADR